MLTTQQKHKKQSNFRASDAVSVHSERENHETRELVSLSDDGTVQTRRVTSGYRAETSKKPGFVDKSESVTDGVTEDNRDEVIR